MKNPNRAFKDAIYEQFARIGKAVSNPKRLELLDIICQGPRTVEVLAKETDLTVANASQHLQVLRTTRLVETEKEGVLVIYRLADQAVCEFFRAMRILAESRLAEVEMIKRQSGGPVGASDASRSKPTLQFSTTPSLRVLWDAPEP